MYDLIEYYFVAELEYDGMVKKMHGYLTAKYKCRESNEPYMSPAEYADVLGADVAGRVISDAVHELEKNMKALEATEVRGGQARESKTFLHNILKKDDYEARGTVAPAGVMFERHAPQVKREEVTAERVITAKARLQAFQEQRKGASESKKN